MLSVVCPIYNEEKHIAKCIDSILSQDYPKEDIEVIFIDGMSNDNTRNIVQEYVDLYPFIKLLDNHARIVPVALNIGIKASSGDCVVRLDAHAEYPNNYFSELVRWQTILNADNIGGVCRTLPVKDTPICNCIASVLSSRFGMGNSHFRIGADEIRQVDTVPFGCFKRDIFDRIGYFDEELVRNQDDEFNARIIKSGGKIYLLPHIVIDYYARDSIRKVYNMFYQYGLFKPLVNYKLKSSATLRQFFPLFFVLGIILGPLTFLISDVFVWIYLTVLICYFCLATYSSIVSTHSVRHVFLQDFIYFVVHWAYGWGYIRGIIKLLFKVPFSVQPNR